ncbi:MAG: hypothetical protein NTW45_13255 [Rhodocyclales bacterium]|nr:hypothetical protein [Rhodocyclales bacterium]
MAAAMRDDAAMEHLFLDSTIVRAHQHSSGAQKSGWSGNWALAGWTDDQTAYGGRHSGNSLRIILSNGQVADIEPATALIKD